jgi:hypothetical protein
VQERIATMVGPMPSMVRYDATASTFTALPQRITPRRPRVSMARPTGGRAAIAVTPVTPKMKPMATSPAPSWFR